MRRNYEIVVFDDKIVHWSGWQVQFKRPPLGAVVEGNVDPVLGSRIEKSTLLRVFTNGTNETALRNAVVQSCPGLAVVAGLIDVGTKIVVLMAVHGNICRTGIVGRGIDLADAAPLRQVFGGNVGPVLAVIAADLDQTIICTHPNQPFLEGRLSHRKDCVVVLRAGIIESDFATGNVLLAFVVTREIRTNRLPMHSAVGGLEQALAAVIERVGIVWGKHYGRGPLETMLEVGGTVGVGKFRLLSNGFHLPNLLVEARDVSLVIGGINNVRVGGIRRDVARFASAYVIPVCAIDSTVIAAAGDGDRSAVLLRAVHPV